MVAAHGKARQELLEVKKEAKKEKEKTGSKVSSDSPVASSELNELCRYLKNENEVGWQSCFMYHTYLNREITFRPKFNGAWAYWTLIHAFASPHVVKLWMGG